MRRKSVYIVYWDRNIRKPYPSPESEVMKRLAAHGVRLHLRPLERIPKKADLVILYNLHANPNLMNLLKRFPRERCMLWAWEPPTVDYSAYVPENHKFFERVVTVQDNITNKKYFHFSYLNPLETIPDEIPFENKDLLTMVVGNKSSSYRGQLYSARRDLIEYFENKDDFKFYGFDWEYCGYRNYLGTVSDKLSTIKNYRFAIAYENTCDVPGYITEKIFNCFQAKCVPVYWGAPNIEEYIPRECFIDKRQFATLDELYAYLKQMPADEHQRYLDAARDFLSSEKAHVFSKEHFVDTMTHHIIDLLNLGDK